MGNEQEKKLIQAVVATQAKLRETIEESKRLVVQSDALIAKVKDGLSRANKGKGGQPDSNQP